MDRRNKIVKWLILSGLFTGVIIWLQIMNGEGWNSPMPTAEFEKNPTRSKREADAEKSTVQFENSTHKIINHDSEGIIETISGDSQLMGEGHKVTTASNVFDDSQDEDRAKQNFDSNTIHGPVTAESMKASSQLIVNPNFAPSNVQMPPCFYQQTPASASAHNGGFVPSPYGMPMYAPPFNGYPYQHQNGRVVNSFPHAYYGYPPMSPMFPPPQPVPCYQMAGITPAGYPYYPFAQEFRTASTPLSAEENTDHHDDMRASDHYRDAQSMSSKIYGNHTSRPSARQMTCDTGLTSCSSDLCISEAKWCDGFVDCPDSSDEVSCPCKSRINPDKLCDGYFDCPLGEDEMGCMGCHPTEFSCDDWTERKSTVTCFKLEQRCDGVPLCPNKKDELDCTMLSDSVRHHAIFAVSQTEGFLHKNYRGKWYPVCENPYLWAAEACEREAGTLTRYNSPFIQIVDTPKHFHGRYIEHIFGSRVTFVPGCFNGKGMYVTCPKLTCGTRINDEKGRLHENFDRSQRNRRHLLEEFIDSESPELIYDVIELEPQIEISPFEEFIPIDLAVDHEGNILQLHQEDHNILDVLNSGNTLLFPVDYDYYDENEEQDFNFTDINRDKRGERIVGGRASEPEAWPWAVAIFKDGRFHCDGTIISEMWVLSAAHCATDYWKHYYEIQLGMLRQFSFSPQEQSHRIAHIIVNSGYHRTDMHNDLSLMMLATPARFNRWVRPACLPSAATAGLDWRWGPRPGTLCTAIGWGALFEHGPDPDHLREVDVPILKNCNHKNDREGHEICAGLPQGGKDACQGDSGGPLLCRNPHNSEQWYILGIVSHGEGCARPGEPGVYTRVSIFVEWIHEHMRTENLPTRTPKRTCPGFTCTWGIKRCLPISRHCDKIVDCLGGEDEANCVYSEGRVNEQQEKPVIPKTINITLSSNRDNSNENSDKTESTAAETIKLSNFTTKTNESPIINREVDKIESIMTKLEDNNQGTETLIPNVSKSIDETTHLSDLTPEPNENIIKNRENDRTESITPEPEDDIQVTEALIPNVSKIIDETTHLSDLTPEPNENLIKNRGDNKTESITPEPENDIQVTEALIPNLSKFIDETTHLSDLTPESNKNIIKNREDNKTELITPEPEDNIEVTEALIPDVSKIINEITNLSDASSETNENTIINREDDKTESITLESEHNIDLTKNPIRIELDGNITETNLTIDGNLKSIVTETGAVDESLVQQTTEIKLGDNMESPTQIPKDTVKKSVIIQDSDDITSVLTEENTVIPVTTFPELDDFEIHSSTLSMKFKTDENLSNSNEEYQNSNENFKSADFTEDDYLETAKSQGDINDSLSTKSDEIINEMQENVSNESVAIDFDISENDKSNDSEFDEYGGESPKSDEKKKIFSSEFLLSNEIDSHGINHTETVTEAVTSELTLNTELNGNPTLASINDQNQTDVVNTTPDAFIDNRILPEVIPAKNISMENHIIETHDIETVTKTVPAELAMNAELIQNTTFANASDMHVENHTDSIITTTDTIMDSNILPEVIPAKNTTMENHDIESHHTETVTITENTELSENNTLTSASDEQNHTNLVITTTETMFDNNFLPEVDFTKNTSSISDNDVNVETHGDIVMNATVQTLSLFTTTFPPIKLTTDKINETTTLLTLDISDNVIDIDKNFTIADVVPSKIHKKEMMGLNDIVVSKRPGFGKSLKDQRGNSTEVESKILLDQVPLTIDIISALNQVEHKGLENVSKTIPALKKPKLPLPNVFVCRRMEQFIPMSKRCNRVPDCEDGTDEFDCSCADYLTASNKYSNLVCDGYLDCLDGTDEEECHFCPEDHFHCHISRTCIPSTAVCNHFSDCSFGEDELDCFALTDGHKVLFDKDLRPHLNVEGIVTSRHKGVWEPVCNIITEPKEREEIALHMCKYLGFKDYYNFNFIELQRQRKMEFVNMTSFARKNHSPQIVEVNTPVLDFPDLSEVEDQLSKGEHPGLEGLSHPFQIQMTIPDHVESCNTLFVRCITNMATNITKHILPEIVDVGTLVPDKSFAVEAEELYMWPWMAKVYVDGNFCCTGVLMDLNWVLAEASCLVQLSISTNYVTVVIGSKQTIPSIVGPYEQAIPVDHIKTLDFSNASMIHLQSPAIYSRYVRPMGMPDFNINSVKDGEICIAVGIDSSGETESVFLQPLQQHCGVMNKCFKRLRDVDCNTDKMTVLASPWRGIVSCHTDEGWFPSAIYNDPLGFCGFSDVVSLPNIAHLRTDIKVTMTRYMEISNWQPPTCDGVRCYRGKCIPMSQVCDGTVDCEFNTDESFNNCQAKKMLCSNNPDDILCACPPGLMHCSSGECIHKNLFSNGVKDCKDGSDEPELITCVSYLNVVSPQLVCDGFQHCLDRTDEDIKFCGCFAKNAYRCEDQSCVAQDFVCDGKPDCPGGEDERLCIGIRSLGNKKIGAGEVIQNTHGLWHTKCFPKPITKKTELEDLCRQLNFHSGHAALLEPSSELIFDPPVQPFIRHYSTVNVNENVTITLRNQPNSIVSGRLLFNGEECFPVYIECA